MCVNCRHWEKSGLVSKSKLWAVRRNSHTHFKCMRSFISANTEFKCYRVYIFLSTTKSWYCCVCNLEEMHYFWRIGIMRVENAVQTTLEWPWESGANAQGCLNRANPVPHPLKLEVTNLPARRSGKVTWDERFDYSYARNTGEFLRLFHLGEVVCFGMTLESAL